MEKKHVEILQIVALVVIYAFLAFYNLGNRESPQTTWEFGDAVIVDFGTEVFVSQFQFMQGARREIDFMLFGSLDGDDWHYSAHISNVEVFSWGEQTVNTLIRFAQIMPFSEGLRLQEVAFRDGNGTLLQPLHILTEGAEVLFDEQNLVPRMASFMNSTYFDEIYHARTGYEFLHGLRVFETTHPPMGKNFIAMGISAFGMTPFGWRFAGTLAGVLMIPLMYLFGKTMFESHFWGMFAAVVFAFDFMPFVQTRIATIDSYVTLFIIASYLCMFIYTKQVLGSSLVKPLLWLLGSGLFIGLAIASKWQGIYALIGLPFIFFISWFALYKQNRRNAWITFGWCFAFFIAIPLTVYLLSYIPFVYASESDGGFLSMVWANQVHMFTYHAGLEEGHPFASNWWEWPLLIRPIFYYTTTLSLGSAPFAEVRQGISSFGSPAVWWTGIVALFYAVFSLKKANFREPTIIFLLIAYAAQFVPWIFVSRATFIYHYFPSLPFVVLLIAFMFRDYFAEKSRVPIIYAGAVVSLFMLFRPVLAGVPVTIGFVETFLRWLPAWLLV
ncbi:MAG: phospholipid carrier-dependent glycosyltransferase [Turicibacter sp.]|nr:phospholipid carrier-dependent glycosyltransferase [Turicibacter sp.]